MIGGASLKDMKFHKQTWALTLIVVLLIVGLGVIPVLLGLMSIEQRIAPAVVANYDVKIHYLPPGEELVCPGDTIQFEPVLHVTVAPMIAEFTQTWWSVDPPFTVEQQKATEITRSAYTETGTFSRPVTATVPNVGPGKYEYRRVVQDLVTSRMAFTTVPITVRDDCPARAAN
jgi:hypothetical protein